MAPKRKTSDEDAPGRSTRGSKSRKTEETPG